jgi:ERCC4-type nuclease
MELIIDEREKTLYELLQKKETNVTLTKCVLPLGDFLIKKNDMPLFLVERKSYSDLLASIKDGRYKEQSYRLQHTEWKAHQIIYLLEGTYSQIQNPNDKKIILSAMTSLSLFKGFHIVRSSSLNDTADILLHMTEKIWKETEKGEVLFSSESPSEKPYSSVVKTIKKDNITAENIGEIMLCQIPGIQTKTASAIMNTVQNSFPELFRILQESPETIEKIRVGDRKINKNVLEKLQSFLLKKRIDEKNDKQECEEG